MEEELKVTSPEEYAEKAKQANAADDAGTTDEDNNQGWDPKAYAKRKAQRNEAKPAEWVVNPVTGEKFYLRKVGVMGWMVSGALPHLLTTRADDAWAAQGLDVGKRDDEEAPDRASTSRGDATEGDRSVALVTQVVTAACVIPRIGRGEGEIDPVLLADEDVTFIFEWATGMRGGLRVKGGGVVPIANLEHFPEKPGSRLGAGDGG